jgi:hypothetical protein
MFSRLQFCVTMVIPSLIFIFLLMVSTFSASGVITAPRLKIVCSSARIMVALPSLSVRHALEVARGFVVSLTDRHAIFFRS